MTPTLAPLEVLDHPFTQRGTFVPINKDELDPPQAEEPPPVFSWQTGALVAALLAIGAGAWWSLQPPSADALYRRVQARIKDGSVDSLPRKGSEIDELQKVIASFLGQYPRDPRAPQLREYEKDLSLRRLEWDFTQKMARTSLDGLLPIEQLCSEAIDAARSDPTRGVAMLQALIDLYSQSETQSGPTEVCLTFARQKLKQFRREAERFTAEQLAVLEERLSEANRVRKDDPEQSRKTYQAIIDLYGDKPWAADMVHRARDAIKKNAQPRP